MTFSRISIAGGSFIITIRKRIAESMGWKPDTPVRYEVDSDKIVIYKVTDMKIEHFSKRQFLKTLKVNQKVVKND